MKVPEPYNDNINQIWESLKKFSPGDERTKLQPIQDLEDAKSFYMSYSTENKLLDFAIVWWFLVLSTRNDEVALETWAIKKKTELHALAEETISTDNKADISTPSSSAHFNPTSTFGIKSN